MQALKRAKLTDKPLQRRSLFLVRFVARRRWGGRFGTSARIGASARHVGGPALCIVLYCTILYYTYFTERQKKSWTL